MRQRYDMIQNRRGTVTPDPKRPSVVPTLKLENIGIFMCLSVSSCTLMCRVFPAIIQTRNHFHPLLVQSQA